MNSSTEAPATIVTSPQVPSEVSVTTPAPWPVPCARPQQPAGGGRRARLHRAHRDLLTHSIGRDLEPVVFGLATWGARWTFGEPAPEELDPDLLLWWLHRRLAPSKLAGPTFPIFVNFTDHHKRYWIVVDHDASLCLADPRFDIDVTVRSDRSTMYRIYLGHVPLADARRAGRVELTGSRAPVRKFIDAFQPTPVASIVGTESPG